MTLETIKLEMGKIRALRKTDAEEAKERWESLSEHVKNHIVKEQLPEMWAKILLQEIESI